MAGGEVYKEFDSSSIVTSTTNSGGTISIRKHTFRTRELVLGLVAFIACVCVLVLAIVLIVEMKDKDSDEVTSSASQSSGQGSSQTGSSSGQGSSQTGSDPAICVSPACLKAALFHKSALDEFVDPCKDFYAYACGGYAAHNPQTPLMSDITPQNQIMEENSMKLMTLLDQEVQRDLPHSYERKLKAFMSSCTNHFDKMELRGTPFLQQVVSQTPGWYLLGQWNESTFDLEDSLRQVHLDFWTPAFFNNFISGDRLDWNKKVVEIDAGGIGMIPEFYTYMPAVQEYAQFVRTVAGLLVRDAGSGVSQDRVNQFAEDAVEMENSLAQIVLNYSPLHNNPHAEILRMTLRDLTLDLNNTIDMTAYMKGMFNEWPNKFEDDTKVVVKREYFFANLGILLQHYLTNERDGKRKLHNYLMWQLLHRYSSSLSWDYVHARRRMSYILDGNKVTDSGAVSCFMGAEQTMPDAINAVFLKTFMNPNNTAEGVRIVDHIKKQVLESLDSFPWLSRPDMITAKNKITGSIQKIGFPDYLKDDSFMDSLYSHVQMTDDFFSNVLALNQLQRKMYNNQMGRQGSRTQWTYHVFLPVIDYFQPWHQLMVTAAALQNPLFSYKGPAYYNYGGIGTAIAKSFIHAIDEIGSAYRLDGSQMGSWWSNTTRTRYAEVKKCALDAQKDKQAGPFNVPGFPQPYRPDNATYKPMFATQMLAEATGLRLSFKAYKKDRGDEKMPPGVSGASPNKMFFLSYAQTKCQNSPDAAKAQQLGIMGHVPYDYSVNLIMAQVPEFGQVYNCPPDSPYSPTAARCQLFP